MTSEPGDGDDEPHTLAGLLDRLLAGVLDFLALVVIVYGVGLVATIANDNDSPEDVFLLATVASMLVVPFAYSTLLETSRWQATVGKRSLGLRVVGPDGERLSLARATVRAATKALSVLPLFAGVFAVALSDNHAAWHDRLTGTRVERTKRYKFGGINNVTTIKVERSQNVTIVAAQKMADVAVNVSHSASTSSTSDEIRLLVEMLAQQVKALSAQVPDGAVEHAEKLTKNLAHLGDEIASSKPDKRWYSLSLAGMKEAAEAIGGVALPIIETVGKLKVLLGC